MSAIAVIDIGKTNAKLTLVDARDGSILSSVARESPSLDSPPYPHLDTAGLFSWLVEQLGEARAHSPIGHIGVSAHGAAAALVDDNDLVLPVLDYEHAGPDEIADEYDRIQDPFVTTYSPKLPHGMNIGRQLYWQRARFGDDFARAKHLLIYPQYIGFKLTGEVAAEYSGLGAHTDLWNPVAQTFSGLAKREGFDRLVPPIHHANATLGRLLPALCDATGIDSDCQVLVGIHDSNASLLPYLKARNAPFTVVSTGTWVITFAVGAPLAGLIEDRDCIANVNAYGDPVACTRYMGGREFGAIAGADVRAGTDDDLNALLDEAIVVLPAYAVEGGPYQGLPGRIDTDRDLSATERTVLASLYSALVSDVCLDLCGAEGDVIVEGAFTKNTMLLQILDTLRAQQNVFASSDNTGTTLGTAMLATDNIPAPTVTATAPLAQDLGIKIRAYRDRWRERAEAHRTQYASITTRN